MTPNPGRVPVRVIVGVTTALGFFSAFAAFYFISTFTDKTAGTDLAGKMVDTNSLLGTVTVVEFWAEWCPPCRSTLAWLGEAQKKYGDKVRILGIAVESEEANIRAMVDSLNLPYANAMGSADIAMKFGDIVSVPTLFVFDKKGRTVRVFYGAPPDLHEQVERAIASAL